MLFKRTPSPHIKENISVQDMMFMVLYALIPGTLASMYFFGWGVLFNLVIAISVCLLADTGLTLTRALVDNNHRFSICHRRSQTPVRWPGF